MINKGKCPLCGGDNHCASALGEDPSTCWCMTKIIPKELLAKIPKEKENTSCICEKCLDDFLKKEV